jgi:hypothetical protein
VKLIAIIAGALAVLNLAHAQGQPNATVIGSGSGQFFISARGGISPHSLELATEPNMLALEPPLLAVSCERIKTEVLRALNMTDQWQGKIFVVLRRARADDDQIFVRPQKLGRNWHCGVDLPDAINQNRLVEAVVRATLLEIANRKATDQPTEIPEWLARGLTRQLMGSSAIKIILRPPRKADAGGYLPISRETADFSDAPQPAGSRTRTLNPLADAMNVLRTRDALTFDQLSWPTDEQLNGAGADVYGSCAQLFVNGLLHLKNGPEDLQAMLADLPDYLNWQLAFDDAFRAAFKSPLEVEKWWALELTQFNGRDLLHLLTPAESSRQLDAVFQFPVDVQIGQAAPMRTDITLQTIIRGWSRTQQLPLLKNKVWELGVLRLRVAPNFMPLVDQYVEVLQNYYKKRSASTRILATMGLISDTSVAEAVARLDALDAERANLREQSRPPAVSAPQTAQAVEP